MFSLKCTLRQYKPFRLACKAFFPYDSHKWLLPNLPPGQALKDNLQGLIKIFCVLPTCFFLHSLRTWLMLLFLWLTAFQVALVKEPSQGSVSISERNWPFYLWNLKEMWIYVSANNPSIKESEKKNQHVDYPAIFSKTEDRYHILVFFPLPLTR